MDSRIFTIRGKTKVQLSHWCDSAVQTNSGPVQRKGGRVREVPAGLLAALESSLLPRSRVTPVIGQFLRDSTSPLLPGSPFTPANWCLSCKLLRLPEPALYLLPATAELQSSSGCSTNSALPPQFPLLYSYVTGLSVRRFTGRRPECGEWVLSVNFHQSGGSS